MGRKRTNLEDKFARHSASAPNSSGCIEWSGSLASNGYGQMYSAGKSVAAHRYAFMKAHSIRELRRDQFICHTCDNPPCVNPEHLFLGTATENMADKMAKGRHKFPLGTQHGRAKLTDADISAIRTSGEPAKSLAEKLGVHPQHVRLIRRKKRIWLHV